MCLVAFSKKEKYSALRKLDGFSGSPTWAYINITEKCSHKCPWCYGGFGQSDNQNMSLSVYKDILEKLKQIGVKQITLSGGEPTEHPDFKSFLSATSLFELHVATHGEHIDQALASFMAGKNVKQVQLNYQGSKNHDRIHGVVSYKKQVEGIRNLCANGIEVTATVTVGEYNLCSVEEIFSEVAALGVTRIRVWEATGRGKLFCKSSAYSVFEYCKSVALKLGYGNCLSYDPVFPAETHIKCLQLSGLYMYISVKGELVFCGAVEDGPVIADMVNQASDEILRRYNLTNMNMLSGGEPWCVAR